MHTKTRWNQVLQAVDLFLTTANFLEQISPSQSVKIFLHFPVAKMLQILIFSIGLFHLTSKNYCSTMYRHGLKKAVCNQRITVWNASELSKASSSKGMSISSYLLKKQIFHLYIKILFLPVVFKFGEKMPVYPPHIR